MDMILQLGFIPNWVKSELAPAQMFMYLGVVFDQVEGSVHPTDAHILFHDISSMYLVRASRISGSTEHVIQMIQETTLWDGHSWDTVVSLVCSSNPGVSDGQVYVPVSPITPPPHP